MLPAHNYPTSIKQSFLQSTAELTEPELTLDCSCSVYVLFNRCDAALTDKITRAKEENQRIKQIMDQTLMEMADL